MSRGISLQAILKKEESNKLEYEIKAGGWGHKSIDQKVGSVIIDHNTQKLSFITLNDWKNELFFIPKLEDLLQTRYEMPDISSDQLNKHYRIWNFHLIRALRRVLTNSKYKEKVWFYH